MDTTTIAFEVNRLARKHALTPNARRILTYMLSGHEFFRPDEHERHARAVRLMPNAFERALGALRGIGLVKRTPSGVHYLDSARASKRGA